MVGTKARGGLMPGFRYEPFDGSHYAASIGDLLARSADPAARAAVQSADARARATEIGGQAYGQAFQQIGQMPNQIMAQQRQAQDAAQLRALRQSEVDQNTLKTQEMQRAQRGQQLLGTLTQQYSTTDPITGIPDVKHEAIAGELTKAGYGNEAQRYLHGASETAEDLNKINAGKRQTNAAVGESIGRQANAANDPADFLLRLDHLTLGGGIPEPIRQKFAAEVQQAGPEGWDALKKRYVDWADSVVKPITTKEGDTIVAGVSHTPIVTGTPKPPTEAELALKAAGGDAQAQGAMKLLKPDKAPPSLEEQYLSAVAKGDTATAGIIKQTWEEKAKASRDPNAAAQLAAIRSLTQQEARARLDARDTTSPASQQKLEQQYRTVLARGLSSRSGGLGGEDAKVQQANHLLSLFEQTYNPKTGGYDLPRVQLNELALGLAKLTAGNSPAGEGMLREFQQRTAKGDIAGALTYLTGQPIAANTQAITTFLKDSIERQGKTAEQNREGEMAYLRGLAPTDLDEARRKALEATSLNPMRQSRLIQNTATGERRLQVSVDGGKTWK